MGSGKGRKEVKLNKRTVREKNDEMKTRKRRKNGNSEGKTKINVSLKRILKCKADKSLRPDK